MLHRYVGGILKDLAIVKSCTVEEALCKRYDLYVVYTMGIVFRQLNNKIGTEQIIPVDLFPMPQGIKKVLELPEGSHLGVIGGHIWDAADLLSQLLYVGVRNYRFSTGTPDIIESLSTDWYIVPEEIAPYIKDRNVRKRIVVMPRMLESKSVSRIISTAIKFRNEKACAKMII
jgi:hypothetical protein